MPVISLEKREHIVHLIKAGWTQRGIANHLKISRCAIQNILKKYNSGLGLTNRNKGKIAKLSKRDQRRIIVKAKQRPHMTANQLRQECGVSNDVSVDTVKRILRKASLFGRIACRKPFLNKKHKQKRLQWCREKLRWTVVDWNRIIFSDESKIDLHTRGRQFVRRSPGKQLVAKYLHQTFKFSPSIMVFGAIRSDGKRYLRKLDGTVNANYYQSVLDDALPHMYTTRYIFQQDGAKIHTAHSTLAYLERKCIRVLPNWPPQSPDMSIIENLWSMLKKNVKERCPTNVQQLWQFAKEEWDAIPDSVITKLYESLPCRAAAVVRSRGGHTKY